MPSYDGNTAIFGFSVRMRMTLNPQAEQLNAFFGVTGMQSLFGGLRGRVFLTNGVLFGSTVGDLNAAEALLVSYIDGVARVLVDTRGRTWVGVKMMAPYEPGERVLQDARGLYLPYRVSLVGLV